MRKNLGRGEGRGRREWVLGRWETLIYRERGSGKGLRDASTVKKNKNNNEECDIGTVQYMYTYQSVRHERSQYQSHPSQPTQL